MAEEKCEHHYVKDGVVYEVQDLPAPNPPVADALVVYYFNSFFCAKCLNRRYEKIDFEANTYNSIRYGAIPMPEKQ